MAAGVDDTAPRRDQARRRRISRPTGRRPPMSSVAAARLVVHRSPVARYKQLLLGPPLATSRLVGERLRKVVALAVFSSDAISSTAYGTEQIMLVLVAA